METYMVKFSGQPSFVLKVCPIQHIIVCREEIIFEIRIMFKNKFSPYKMHGWSNLIHTRCSFIHSVIQQNMWVGRKTTFILLNIARKKVINKNDVSAPLMASAQRMSGLSAHMVLGDVRDTRPIHSTPTSHREENPSRQEGSGLPLGTAVKLKLGLHV